MNEETESVLLVLEVEGSGSEELLAYGSVWVGEGELSPVTVRLVERETGHGFGLSMTVGVLVSIGVGTASNLVADAVRVAIKRLIIKASGSRSQSDSDGSREGLVELIERERGAAGEGE
ncbi:hypothetical protein [Streptomyces olivochromogenes]|uniref:hypothetical protein n=1 Tax=Streptomyces olivochromogenes TaxID=1963 RepID=UPI0036AE441B